MSSQIAGYYRFIDNLKGSSIENYFGITNKPNINLNFTHNNKFDSKV